MRRYRVVHRDVYEEHDLLMVGVVRAVVCKTWIGAWWVKRRMERRATTEGRVEIQPFDVEDEAGGGPYR